MNNLQWNFRQQTVGRFIRTRFVSFGPHSDSLVTILSSPDGSECRGLFCGRTWRLSLCTGGIGKLGHRGPGLHAGGLGHSHGKLVCPCGHSPELTRGQKLMGLFSCFLGVSGRGKEEQLRGERCQGITVYFGDSRVWVIQARRRPGSQCEFDSLV